MPQVALGQFTGMITAFRNQSIILGLQPVINLITEIVGNDEFKNRAGSDDSTQRHMIQLIADCDQRRRLITYNPEDVDLRSVASEVIDPKKELGSSLKPVSLDGIQLGSTPEVEIPWKFDGTNPNIPLWQDLEFRNGIGGFLYGAACRIAVNYTRLESRNRSYMITVNDSLRMFSYMQTFRDLCDNLLGHENQVDIANPLATDEPSNNFPPNRNAEQPVNIGAPSAGGTPAR